MWIPLLPLLLLNGDIIFGKRVTDKRTQQKNGKKVGSNENTLKCPVNLPQKSTPKCKRLREQGLDIQRGIFQLAKRPPLPMPLVNMTTDQLKATYLHDKFTKNYFLLYGSMLLKNKGFAAQWRAKHPAEITGFEEYENMFKEFRKHIGSNDSSGFYRFASNVEPFADLLKGWKDDDIFAEQRLSGCNPMVLRRVTEDSDDVGLKWSELSKTLNPNYDWEAAIQNAADNDEPLAETIRRGKVYVLRYEVFDDMVSFQDSVDRNPNRILWPSKSPVALFALRSDSALALKTRLRPAAIQTDYKPDSPVYSPEDGDSWTLAKMVVQATDYPHSQMIEHLLKVHLLAEPFCVVLYRQFSSQHPLHEILKYHCRGLIATNTLGSPTLIMQHGYMDQLTAMGRQGTVLLLERGYKNLGWNDTDFHRDIKERGLDDEEILSYFPYRDDSKLLLLVIRRMVEDYVSTYYGCDKDVEDDKELQAFVNELSIDGTGPDGGQGKIKDFPPALHERGEVIDMVTRLIWLLSVKHAVVNYPVSDYGAFTPLSPTKIFNDTRVPPGKFSFLNLPNGDISSAQVEVAMNVGAYHYDTLFDYYDKLSDPVAKCRVEFYYYYFRYAISPMLQYENQRRHMNGHLTYPYLQHPWLPNGIQS